MNDATDALDRAIARAPLSLLAALAIAAELALSRRAHGWADALAPLDPVVAEAFRQVAEHADWRRRGLARELGPLLGDGPPAVEPCWVEALLSPAWAGAPAGSRAGRHRPEGVIGLERTAAMHARDLWLRAGSRARDEARRQLCGRLADLADARLRPETQHLVAGRPIHHTPPAASARRW